MDRLKYFKSSKLGTIWDNFLEPFLRTTTLLSVASHMSIAQKRCGVLLRDLGNRDEEAAGNRLLAWRWFKDDPRPDPEMDRFRCWKFAPRSTCDVWHEPVVSTTDCSRVFFSSLAGYEGWFKTLNNSRILWFFGLPGQMDHLLAKTSNKKSGNWKGLGFPDFTQIISNFSVRGGSRC